MKVAAFWVFVVLARSSIAAAQPGATEPQTEPQPAPAVAYGEPVSENVALALTLGGTVAAYGMWFGGAAIANHSGGSAMLLTGALGTLFAPSFGHWYAHRAFPGGFKMRLLGIGAVMVGGMLALSQCGIGEGAEENCSPSLAIGTVILGGGLYVGGTVWDIATARSAARDYNRRSEAPPIALVPMVQRNGGGLTLAGTF